jgi:hypothetical protein
MYLVIFYYVCAYPIGNSVEIANHTQRRIQESKAAICLVKIRDVVTTSDIIIIINLGEHGGHVLSCDYGLYLWAYSGAFVTL